MYKSYSLVDFSFASNGMLLASFQKYLFVETDFREHRVGQHFEDCVFQRAKLSHSSLVGTYVSCTFRGANLTSARLSQARFERCEFDCAIFRAARIEECRFLDCTWTGSKFGGGSVAGSHFLGPGVVDLDPADAYAENSVISANR